jgi:hypothetical protein
MKPESTPNGTQAERARPGDPTDLAGGGQPSSDYRHDVDLRFVTPRWLGRRYFDLRIGRDVRGASRPLALPRTVRRRNGLVLAFGAQMVVSWFVALGLLCAFASQIGCGVQPGPPIGGVDGSNPAAPGEIEQPAVDQPTQPTAGTGEITFSVTWPEVSAAMIPTAAQSILLTVTDAADGKVVGSAVLTRAAPSASIASLPAWHQCTVRASAFPTTTGTGVAQATASQVVTIPDGAKLAVKLVMATTISKVVVTASRTQFGVKKSVTLVPTAKDAAGNVVLVAASRWSFTSSVPTRATVTQAGVVTGVAPGAVTVTAKDLDSGKAGTVALTVLTPGVSASPTTLDFSTTATSKTFVVAGTGEWTPKWTATPSAAWVTATPSSGTGGATVTVKVNRTGLSVGAHTATVKVVSDVGTVTVTIKATVTTGGVDIGVS